MYLFLLLSISIHVLKLKVVILQNKILEKNIDIIYIFNQKKIVIITNIKQISIIKQIKYKR